MENSQLFSGKLKTAVKYAQRGCYFSVPNTAAKEGAQMQKLIGALPLESILLETDSPALSLVPGQLNAPKNLVTSAKTISAIKNLPVETVINETTKNAIRLFPRN